MQGYSTGANDKCDFTGMDEDGKITVHQRGEEWELEFIGEFKVERKIGDPAGVPPAGKQEGEPIDPDGKNPEPFNPNIPTPFANLSDIDPIGGGIGGLETEPPNPELVKDKEMPMEKTLEKIKEKPKTKVKKKEGES